VGWALIFRPCLPRHGQTPARRLHLPESECSGKPDAHPFNRSSRREPAQTSHPPGIMSGLTSAATQIIAGDTGTRLISKPGLSHSRIGVLILEVLGSEAERQTPDAGRQMHFIAKPQ